MLTPGSHFGQYHVLSCVGQGTQGTVYKAIDTRLDRQVALKVINEELADSVDFRRSLANEAKKAAQIDSPYVVKVWEYAEIDDSPFISYEFVTGEEFRQACNNLTIEQKLTLARKVGVGLQAAHARDVIHRDLKPENIRITTDGDPKILDFGLASTQHGHSVDSYGEIEGTIAYASPEQLSAEPISYSSDLFSFGIVLYELFTGRRPFEGDQTASVMYALLYEDPVGPQEIDPDLPVWLCDLIVHLLQKQTEDRPASMSEVIEAIDRNLVSDQPGLVAVGISRRSRTVTVVDLKNLSGDKSWDYFCLGFTDDVIGELTRRTDLVVSAEPSTSLPRNINEIFERCHSDFVMTGSLMKWQDRMRLQLGIYGNGGEEVVSSRKYEGPADNLFTLLSTAAEDAAGALAEATGTAAIEAEETVAPDVSAYDFYLRGRNYYQTNRPDDLKFAEEMFGKALEIDPSFALAHTGLSDVYAFRYMAYYDRSSKCIAAARAEAEKALEMEPQMPEAHRSLGRFYMFTGDGERAEAAFLKAVEYNPKYAVGYRTIAWLKATEGNLSEGLTWAKKALQLAPTDLETLLLISLIHMDSRKFTVAMATLQRAIELGPDYGRAYYNLGTVYLKLGVVEQALENFQQAVKYDGDPNARHYAGYVHMILKDHDSARSSFREAIDAGHFPFIAMFYLGVLEKHEGNEQQARVFYDQCLESIDRQSVNGETDTNLLVHRAMALAGRGDKDEAIRNLQQVATGENHSGEVHYCMARAYAILGEKAQARACLQESFDHHDGPTEQEVALDPLLSNL